MKTLLVSLISDQTIPNLLFIKEFQSEINHYLFLTTKAMEDKGCLGWTENAAQIQSTQKLVVKEFSFEDITSKLDTIDFAVYDKILVNLTGGTKVMVLASHDYFKNLGGHIYYITKPSDGYMKFHPDSEKKNLKFKSRITIHEYLEAYGFQIKENKQSGIPLEYTNKIFELYRDGVFDKYIEELKFLRKKKEKKLELENGSTQLKFFLKEIDFPLQDNRLSKRNIKYLTGEWFEEYIGLNIKKAFSLSDEELLIGVTVSKQMSQKLSNNLASLIGRESKDSPNNEFDVIYIKDNQFFSIECKTSIIDIRESFSDEGKKTEKNVNILGETIYKVDSLKSKFGLFANSTIMTLTDFVSYIENEKDKGKRNNIAKTFEEYINRANLSSIKIVDGKMLKQGIREYFNSLEQDGKSANHNGSTS